MFLKTYFMLLCDTILLLVVLYVCMCVGVCVCIAYTQAAMCLNLMAAGGAAQSNGNCLAPPLGFFTVDAAAASTSQGPLEEV